MLWFPHKFIEFSQNFTQIEWCCYIYIEIVQFVCCYAAIQKNEKMKLLHKTLNEFLDNLMGCWRTGILCRMWMEFFVFRMRFVLFIILNWCVPSLNHNKLFAFCLNLHSISSQSLFFFRTFTHSHKWTSHSQWQQSTEIETVYFARQRRQYFLHIFFFYCLLCIPFNLSQWTNHFLQCSIQWIW